MKMIVLFPVIKVLKEIIKQLQKLVKELEKLDSKKKVAQIKKKITDTEKVIEIIKNSKQGADVEKLRKKTGFDNKKVNTIVYKATKKGLIKRVNKGTYKIS